MEYKKDKDTTIKEKNNCALGIMKSRNIYENDILKYKAEYEHDEYGNVVKEKKYKTSTSYDSIDIVYDSNYAYPIKITENGITKLYTYDIMGRLKMESDGKGNITQYEYNTLGDITKIIYPDGNTSSNEYDYINNDITITAQNGSKVKYNYNPAGKLESITDLTTGVITENRIYDEHMRTKEKTERGGKLKTEYTYDVYDRITDKKISDKLSGKEIRHEVYTYTDGTIMTAQRSNKRRRQKYK